MTLASIWSQLLIISSSVSAFTQRCQSAVASEQTCEQDTYPHFSHWKAETVFELSKPQIIYWMDRPKTKQLLSRAVSCAFRTAAIPTFCHALYAQLVSYEGLINILHLGIFSNVLALINSYCSCIFRTLCRESADSLNNISVPSLSNLQVEKLLKSYLGYLWRREKKTRAVVELWIWFLPLFYFLIVSLFRI